MEDEETPADHDGAALLYDYFKHLTGLCLFSLGGVAALTDKVAGRSLVLLIITFLVIGLAGLISFTATGSIVDSRAKGKPIRRDITYCRHAAPLMLSVGLGMFLYLFVTARGH
ncbi:hypothetical protein [Sphingomonas elodea]|uniref:hypothetical protein n=1 Tax=Sphingomonas elodea TaxID=179878 RepID=UPI0002630A41|nr:hypothetical protein [Sphingomonas elodea]